MRNLYWLRKWAEDALIEDGNLCVTETASIPYEVIAYRSSAPKGWELRLCWNGCGDPDSVAMISYIWAAFPVKCFVERVARKLFYALQHREKVKSE